MAESKGEKGQPSGPPGEKGGPPPLPGEARKIEAKTEAKAEANAADAHPGTRERRASARMPVEMWVEDLTDGGVVYRRAGNLSRGGLYLDQTIPLPIGSRVKLRFSLPDESTPLSVTGQIVSINSRERLGMGVKFIDIDRAAQDRIGTYIERLSTPPLGLSTG